MHLSLVKSDLYTVNTYKTIQYRIFTIKLYYKLSSDERVLWSQEHRPPDLNDVQNIELERHSIQ